jgi:hypothetical protein
MKNIIFSLFLITGLMIPFDVFCQSEETTQKTKIMTLGVFHFAYPNLDVVKIAEEDQISVLEEPWQTEINDITDALKAFDPSVIAVEMLPDMQPRLDSLYTLYRAGEFEPKENEVYQLGFRLAEKSGLSGVYAVDDMGRHYNHIQDVFEDEEAMSRFEDYFYNSPDSIYYQQGEYPKEKGITDQLIALNNPERIQERLGLYLLNPFKYEEEEGDFTGVDFETGRWFNRNLRIFRNIQRLSDQPGERILLIVGADHLTLLNYFFEVSKEFELESPLPLLEGK